MEPKGIFPSKNHLAKICHWVLRKSFSFEICNTLLARFQEIILLIVQYEYKKSCAKDQMHRKNTSVK